MKGLIGKKVGMTQVYDDKGVLIPVTVVAAGPCKVVGVKTIEKDGYSAVQVGFGEKKAKNVSKAVKGPLAKAGVEEKLSAVIREFRVAEGEFELGAELKADMFAEGEFLDVTGTTKGRGFPFPKTCAPAGNPQSEGRFPLREATVPRRYPRE